MYKTAPWSPLALTFNGIYIFKISVIQRHLFIESSYSIDNEYSLHFGIWKGSKFISSCRTLLKYSYYILSIILNKYWFKQLNFSNNLKLILFKFYRYYFEKQANVLCKDNSLCVIEVFR